MLEPIPEEVFNSNLVIKSRTLYDAKADKVDGKGQPIGPDEASRHPSAARDPQGTYPRALHKINPAWVAAQKRREPVYDKAGQLVLNPKESNRTLMVAVVDAKDEAVKRKQGWYSHDELLAKHAFDVVDEHVEEPVETI